MAVTRHHGKSENKANSSFTKRQTTEYLQRRKNIQRIPVIDRKQNYILKDHNGIKNYAIATCCNPIPGDDVLGYVDENETVIVHKRECPVAMRLKSSFGPRLVSTQWESGITQSFPATILIEGIDRIGILNEITRTISNELNINIRNLAIEAQEGVFHGSLNILVHDAKSVETLCRKLKKIKGVKAASRAKE